MQTETNATVMAMEKGAKQMQRGLILLGDVAQATEQVRLRPSSSARRPIKWWRPSPSSRTRPAGLLDRAADRRGFQSLAGLAIDLESTTALNGAH